MDFDFTAEEEEFREEGFILTEEKPEILVLAFDKELTYARLELASKFLQQNIPYIATHLDDRCPTEEGFIPDAGGIASLLKKATGKRKICAVCNIQRNRKNRGGSGGNMTLRTYMRK